MDNDWEAAWERDRTEVARAMHEGWRRWMIASGFADHPFMRCYLEDQRLPPGVEPCQQPRRCHFKPCSLLPDKHHPDMIPWEHLPPEQQAINYEVGREGYRLGYLAGQAAPIPA